MISVFLFLLALPFALLFCVIQLNMASTKRKLSAESELVDNSVGSPTINTMFGTSESDRLSPYEAKIVLLKIELASFLKKKFEGLSNWEIIDPNNIAEDNSFFIMLHFFSGKKQKILIRKELSKNGFAFSIATDKEDKKPEEPKKPKEPTGKPTISADEWIKENLDELVKKRKSVQQETDFFILEIPLPDDQKICEEIKEKLEDKGFFFVTDEEDIKVYF